MDVRLACPNCGHTWLAAMLKQGESITPETIAKQCFCPACMAVPPMQIVKPESRA